MKKFIDSVHHFFIPRHTNNFRAKLLHHDFLTVYLVVALALTLGVNHIQRSQGSILGYATDISITKLYNLANEERAKVELPPLTYNEKLAEAAEKKAKDMFAKDYWSHYGPSGETPWEFILGSGYQYEYAGENLAKNFLFSDGVVKAWMESPTHKENIIRKEYTEVGYAVANGVINGEETTLVVQMFGKPLYAAETAGAQPTEKETPEFIEQVEQSQPNQAVENPMVLAKESSTKSNFFPIYFNMNILFFAILILALILDFYFAAKLNIISIKGKNLIHIVFLFFIAIGAFILVRGSIT